MAGRASILPPPAPAAREDERRKGQKRDGGRGGLEELVALLSPLRERGGGAHELQGGRDAGRGLGDM